MMKSLLSLLVLFSFFGQAQHTISGTISPPENLKQVFLYKAEPTGSYYVDKGRLDVKNSFSISLDSSATKGIYKVVYGLPTEEFNFDVLYNGNENIEFLLEGGLLSFEESRQNIYWDNYFKNFVLINNSLNELYTEESIDKEKYNDVISSLKQLQDDFESQTEGDMVHVFIRANRPYIPQSYESIGTYFNHVRENYLKHVDFSNQYLQSSDFLTEKVLVFVFDLVSNPNDIFYKEQVDRLVNFIGDGNIQYKMTMLNLIWQQFVAIENDSVANYITDTYLKQLATNTNNKTLLETITTHKKISLGETAQNFDLTLDGSPTTLLDLNDSEHYLLIFWSSTCGHCLNELPQLKDFLEKDSKKDLTVIAYAIEDGEYPWKETIKQFPNFVHVLGLEKWNNPIAKAYGLHATPAYFLLDKHKKIVAKPYDLEALEKILDN